jgi:hypothetical protein
MEWYFDKSAEALPLGARREPTNSLTVEAQYTPV